MKARPTSLISGVLMVLCFSILSVGCGTSGKERPDWVDGPAAQYPASEFLHGRGDAETVELAQERARADLAKIFEVSISVEASDMQRAQSGAAGARSEAGAGSGNGKTSKNPDVVRYEARSEQRIVTRTDKVVSGLRIAELWRAPSTDKTGGGRQYALAVLPRLQAGMALRQEIAERDDAINRQVQRARSTLDALDRAGFARRAVDLARERAGFDKSLRVVDLGGRGVDTPLALARLNTDLDEQLKRVVLVPTLKSSGLFDDASLLPLLKGAIAESGFLAAQGDASGSVSASDGGATAYSISVNVRLNEQFQEGWHWLRGNIEVTLTDASGRVRGNKFWPIKASAQEQKAARARGLLEIERLLKQEMRAAILDFSAS